MNILFDFISTQGIFNGGAEYTLRVFDSLYNEVVTLDRKVELYCLFDRSLPSPYDSFSYDNILKKYPQLNILFINDEELEGIVVNNMIDVFFIGIGQRYLEANLSKLRCKVIMVIHDALYSEDQEGHFTEYLNSFNSRRANLIRRAAHNFKKLIRPPKVIDINAYFESISNSKNIDVITVSEYSKNSLMFYGGIRVVKVLYSPSKILSVNQEIESQELKKFFKDVSKYLLIVSSDRVLKNAQKALKAVKRYRDIYDSQMCVLTIGMKEPLFKGHYCLPYLSPSDLEYVFKNCYALLYPSVLEGFGYPPLEVMKYGKPVLSSNVCSMPEILGDAPSYFSPFYISDIFSSIVKLSENYDYYSKKSEERIRVIKKRQEADLKLLIKLILH